MIIALSPGLPWEPPASHEISSGDSVKAEVDVDLFESLQEGHGGFNEQMAEVENVFSSAC